MAAKQERNSDIMKFDLRLVEREIREGKVDPKDYEAYLKKLPDDGQNAEYVEVFEEPVPEEATPHRADDLTFT